VTTIGAIAAALAEGSSTPEREVAAAYERLADAGDPSIAISLVPESVAMARARELRDADRTALPLYGVPFAVKDNIDVAGVATTAGCAAYSYVPERSAAVVRRLEAAGAIAIAKTNLDQFATGLVGTRSPYGMPINPRHPDRVPGGSSSGSAVAVARGIVPFALGTDTAGSGRVPAAFCGIVGLKPTRGWLSNDGVVPAIRALDCVSVFSRSVADGWAALHVAAGFEANDPSARARPSPWALRSERPLRVGIADIAADALAGDSVAGLARDHRIELVDIGPLLEVGALLYGGPWVAARYAAVGAFVVAHPDAMDPTVQSIILDARRWSAADAAAAEHDLAQLRVACDAIWDRVDVLVLPTTPLHPTPADVAADPTGVNTEVGRFTTFANLLDLCAVAIPPNLSVVAPAWCDAAASEIAARLAGWDVDVADDSHVDHDAVLLVVVGAHLRGEPLHHQLCALGAELAAVTRTAPRYRLFALANTSPPKPGLVRDESAGAAIEVEVYRLSVEAFGRFVASVPPPLAIGTVFLEDGSTAMGFVCEPVGLGGACDITELGGWRHYDARRC
jgi:allophanate hydrolase